MSANRSARVLNLLGQPRVYVSLAIVAVAAFAPMLVSSSIQRMLVLTFIIGTGAIAWNVIGGYGGQFSLGNGVFFGASAYVFSILLLNFGQGIAVALPASLLGTLLIAVVIGYPAFRLRSHYFALATIVVVEGARFLVRHFRDFTGGEVGLSLAEARVRGVATLGFTDAQYYLLGLALFAGAAFLSAYIRYTKLGFYLMAIRDDQQAAAAVGIDTSKYKMYGWLVSALLTGLAGVMYAIYVQYLDPNFMFGIPESVLLAVIPIIGGAGTITGPVIGSLIMWPLLHIATTQFGGRFGAIAYMGYGTILILMIMYAPEGIVAQFKAYGHRIERRLPIFTVGETDPSFGWD